MMAFSSGLRVPTISAQREREAGQSERCREGGWGQALGSCGRNRACSGLEAKPLLRLCRQVLQRQEGNPNRWLSVLIKPGFVTQATGSGKEALF